VVRGSAHLSELDDERIAGIAIGPGLVFVAAIWFVLSLAGATADPVILGDAFAATVTFVTAGLLSMGLARLAGLRETGTGPAGRHTWVGMLVAVIAGLLAVALPLALVIGAPVDTAVRGVLGPLSSVLVPIVMILALPAALVLTALVALLDGLRGVSGGSTTGIDISVMLRTDFGSAVNPSGAPVVAIGLVPIVLAVVVAFLVVRTLLHRTGRFAMDGDVQEIRETERPSSGIRLHLPERPTQRRTRVPQTASEAYLATLDLLARTPGSARLASETPREHALRIGSDPAWLPLRRLAADYTLAEFGRRMLTAAEHRRAIDSWRRISAMIREGRHTRP
jgi:hypothetical protein